MRNRIPSNRADLLLRGVEHLLRIMLVAIDGAVRRPARLLADAHILQRKHAARRAHQRQTVRNLLRTLQIQHGLPLALERVHRQLRLLQHSCQLAYKPRFTRGNLKVIVLVGRCHCPRAEECRPQVRPAAALARQVMAHNRPPVRHHAVFVLINQVECQHQPL